MKYIKLSWGSDKSMQVATALEYGKAFTRSWRLNGQVGAATDVIPEPLASFAGG